MLHRITVYNILKKIHFNKTIKYFGILRRPTLCKIFKYYKI
jgi:hypothetical protein